MLVKQRLFPFFSVNRFVEFLLIAFHGFTLIVVLQVNQKQDSSNRSQRRREAREQAHSVAAEEPVLHEFKEV